MPRFSVTIPDDLNQWLEKQVGDEPGASKSGAAREQLQRARSLDEADGEIDDLLEARDRVAELERERDRLRERLDDREDRIDELEEQLARRSQVEEKVDGLATRVEEQQATANAPFFIRWAKWWRDRREDEPEEGG